MSLSRFFLLSSLLLFLSANCFAESNYEITPSEYNDNENGRNWLTYGRTHNEQRFSPLTEINDETISRLGLEWSLELPDARQLVGTTLAVDGVLYVTSSFSVVTAIDIRTRTVLWRFDPEVTKHAGKTLRVLWSTSRGVAYWDEKIFVGAGDGRLIAVDAKTGKQIWTTMTVEPESFYYITGAPRAYNGKVVIGNGGTEMGPARGYVTAYDTDTGEQIWRFWIVPGNPADGFEDNAMRMAAKTWTGEWWKYGGGGNVWNAITYDPEYNHIYLGTGNGSPWNQKIRSPGGGDNLFLCSIVALDADTGRYKWHYQTVPGESWDFNSAMDIVSVDLDVHGQKVKTLMHAPKNGFFYIINRANGKLLSAKPFAKVTWATEVDMKTGRPIEVEGSRYEDGEVLIWPGPIGAHNWQPMSWNPETKLMYFPYHDLPGYYNDKNIRPAEFLQEGHKLQAGVAYGAEDTPPEVATTGLLAWDPLTQSIAWKIPNEGFAHAGTMTTAGNLVFQGLGDGRLIAYRANDGVKVWEFDTGLGISAPPITFETDGRQFIALPVGYGGGQAMVAGSLSAQHGWPYGVHPRRLLVFALDGKAVLPATPPPIQISPVDDPSFVIDEKLAEKGAALWSETCAWCHGGGAVSGGGAPDLRMSGILFDLKALKKVVVDGDKELRGMPKYPEFTDDDLKMLQHFVRQKAKL